MCFRVNKHNPWSCFVYPILGAFMTAPGSQGCHVLSGGTGALGLVFAAWMAEHGARLGEDELTRPRVEVDQMRDT